MDASDELSLRHLTSPIPNRHPQVFAAQLDAIDELGVGIRREDAAHVQAESLRHQITALRSAYRGRVVRLESELGAMRTAHTGLVTRHADLVAATSQAAGVSVVMGKGGSVMATASAMGGMGGSFGAFGGYDPLAHSLSMLNGGGGGGAAAAARAAVSPDDLSRDAAAVLSGAFTSQSQSLTRKIAAMTYDSDSDDSSDEGGGGAAGTGGGGGGDEEVSEAASELQTVFQRLLYQASAMQIAYQRQIQRQTAARDAARSEAAQLRALALSLHHHQQNQEDGGGLGRPFNDSLDGDGGNNTAHLLSDFNAAAAAAAAIGQVNTYCKQRLLYGMAIV